MSQDMMWAPLGDRGLDRRGVTAAAIAIALLLSGCASTARRPTAETSPSAGASAVSPGTDPSADAKGARGAAAAGLNGTRAEVRGSLPDATYATPAAGGPRGSHEGVGPSGPGVTATTITFGLAWPRDLDETYENVRRVTGLRLSPPDTPRILRAVAWDINRRGGIAGRRLKIEVWRYDGGDYSTTADYVEAECAHFTQDVSVFSVFTWFGDMATYHCYETHGMPFVESWMFSLDDAELRRLRHAFSVSFPNLSRLARLNAAGLADAGFLTKGSRIGLVTFDHPVFVRPVEQVLKPALAARGMSLEAEARVGWQDIGVTATEINNAVLRFRRDGIDKVLFLENNTLIATLFTRSAEAQQYRGFRYGLTSASSPEIRDEQGNRWLPAAQMHGAVSLGWAPLGDIPQAQGLELLGAPAERCLDIVERDGTRYDRNACCDMWTAFEICERAWFLETAIEAGGRDAINATSFRLGAESLGSSFDAPTAFGLTFEPGKHDGPGVYRVARWITSCGCFHYTSRARPMP